MNCVSNTPQELNLRSGGLDNFQQKDLFYFGTHFNISQVVTLGCFGLDNCIKFEIVASLGPEEEQPPSGWRFAQLEVADNDFDDHDDDHNHHQFQ